MSDVTREEFEFVQDTVRALVIRQAKQEAKIDELNRKHENNLKDWESAVLK